MFNLKSWLNFATNPQDYIWIKALLLKETPKAILIRFNDREIWLPKVWIVRRKRNKKVISIKISQWHWGKIRLEKDCV